MKDYTNTRTLKSLLSFLLVVAMLSMSFPMLCVSADEVANYAYKDFGDPKNAVNLTSDWDTFVTKTKDGRTGWQSMRDSEAIYIWMDIADSFMYDLPLDTPVDITVEYYDEGNGWFCIDYDSWNPAADFYNNPPYGKTERVFMQNTKQWTSHTFHIEDMKAANRAWGDFRVTLYDPTYGRSPEDIVFGSVKVEHGDYLNPLKASAGLGHVGNSAAEDEDISLTINAKNKSDADIGYSISGKVYDSYGRCIEEIEKTSFELSAKEERVDKIPMTNPKKHGLYRIEGEYEVDYREKGETLTVPYTVKFSVSDIFDSESGNTEYGACHQIMGYYMGNPEEVAEVYNRVGLTYIRDDLFKGTKVDGKWKLDDDKIEGWRILKEHNITTIGILFGPQTFSGLPANDSQMKEYTDWVRDIVEQTKDVIDVYELWNEPNIAAFNASGVGPDGYAKMCKAAYPIIKEISPDCTVLGLGTAAMDGLNIDEKFTRGVFEAGGYDYMDALSIHPYDWSGEFRDDLWIESANLLHEIMREYGEEKPVWITEFGFSTFIGLKGYTRQRQYQNFALSRSMAKSMGLYDKYCFYCFSDRGSAIELEENWGIINYYGAEESPYSAKESFVAMAAYNRFINQNAEVKDTLKEDSVYAFHYYNNDLKKDILHLQSNDKEAQKGYYLGCTDVDVYDAYGNLMGNLKSDDGVFSFIVSQEPIYITGNFSDFKETEYKPPAKPVSTSENGAANDIISFKFEKNTDAELTFEVEDVVEVVENKGFSDNIAEIKIKVPDKTDEKVLFTVAAKDSNGDVRYCGKMIMNITTPIETYVHAEPASKLSNNFWRVRATVKNLGNTNSISGTFSITGPDTIAVVNRTREFKNLAPGGEITYLFLIPEKVNKNVIDLQYKTELDTGYVKEESTNINFTTVKYAYEKPVIDGVIDDGEWLGNWIGADEEKDVKEIENWGGPEDISFSGNIMWDEDNLYFLGIATDDVHYNQFGDDLWNLWSTDSFQMGLDDRKDINPIDAAIFTELGIASKPWGGAGMYRYSSLYKLPAGEVTNCEIVCKRYNGYTVYECRIPWSEIFYEGYKASENGSYHFSVMANDNDGDGRGWIEYMSGIGNPKLATLFGEMYLVK